MIDIHFINKYRVRLLIPLHAESSNFLLVIRRHTPALLLVIYLSTAYTLDSSFSDFFLSVQYFALWKIEAAVSMTYFQENSNLNGVNFLPLCWRYSNLHFRHLLRILLVADHSSENSSSTFLPSVLSTKSGIQTVAMTSLFSSELIFLGYSTIKYWPNSLKWRSVNIRLTVLSLILTTCDKLSIILWAIRCSHVSQLTRIQCINFPCSLLLRDW